MTWVLTGSGQKSEAEVTRLVHEVIQAEDFDRTHFHGFNAHTKMNCFDKSEDATSVDLQDGWKESPVDILVPTRERNPDGNGQPFTIPGLFHRSLTGVIHAIFAEKATKWFHLTPLSESGNLLLQVKNNVSMMSCILQMHGSLHTMIYRSNNVTTDALWNV